MSPMIDRLCDEFEAAWRQGRPVSIESLLHRADAAEREPLLEELIRVEIALRRDAGQLPHQAAYLFVFLMMSRSFPPCGPTATLKVRSKTPRNRSRPSALNGYGWS